MSEKPAVMPVGKENVGYDALYRGQPVVAELVRSAVFHDGVLVAGCGTGDNTILLAEHGCRVTGVDCSPTALERARTRAAAVGARVEVVRTDATRLAEVDDGRFATVLDSALYHCLDEGQRRRYVAALRRVSRPDARLHLVCRAEGTPGVRHPMAVSVENLHANLGKHWEIKEIRPTSLTTSLVRDSLTEEAVAQFGQAGVMIGRDRVEVDVLGRIVGPAWYLHAVRR